MTDINDVSVNDAMSSMEPTEELVLPTELEDWDGWTIDVRQSYPFETEDLEGMNEVQTLALHLYLLEYAIRDAYPGAAVYVNEPQSEPAGVRILVIGPLMVEDDGSNADAVHNAEEAVCAGVQDIMEGVWSEGAFWVPA